jgi:hypothetical protein
MEQSGLKIPHLQDALTAFMGGTDEAKEVAAMIIDLPDPAKLLREFTRQYRRQSTPTTAANGPIVTPPPATAPARPMPASSAPPAAASKGAATPSSPRPKPAAFRPSSPARVSKPPRGPRPQTSSEARRVPAGVHPRGARGRGSVPPRPRPRHPTPRPAPARSLVDALAERLEVLTQQMHAHQRELDTRIRCAEAELAALCEELENLRVSSDRPVLFVVPSIDEEERRRSTAVAAPATTSPLSVDGAQRGDVQLEGSPATSEPPILAETDPAAPEPAVAAETAVPMAAEAEVSDTALSPPGAGSPPLPSAASEADLARAFSMLGKFTDQAAAHYASEAERVRALERKISHLRGVVERGRGSAASRG